jgi:uncharacterized protein YlxW (UPF0749 family)
MELKKIKKNFFLIFLKILKKNSNKTNRLVNKVDIIERNFTIIKNLEKKDFEYNSNEQFLYEKNLKLSNELVETRKKLEVLSDKVIKLKNEKNEIILKLNSINNNLENFNVIKKDFKKKTIDYI